VLFVTAPAFKRFSYKKKSRNIYKVGKKHTLLLEGKKIRLIVEKKPSVGRHNVPTTDEKKKLTTQISTGEAIHQRPL
jgi:hypothetical protein